VSEGTTSAEEERITHAYFMRIRERDREEAARCENAVTQRLVTVEANMADIVKDMASFNRWSITLLGSLTLGISAYLGALIVTNNDRAADNRVSIAETVVVVRDLGNIVVAMTDANNKRFDGVDTDVKNAYEKLDSAIIRHRGRHDSDRRGGSR